MHSNHQNLKLLKYSSESTLETIGKYAFAESLIKSITIPSSVTTIEENAFNNCVQLDEIIISSDSKLQTIEKDALSYTIIKNITIPSELIELNEGWCIGISGLTEIAVSPKNPRYCCYENTMIIGKSNVYQDNYDCLVFCVRDIKHIKISNFIKHICSCSFNHCEQLEEVIIPSDSKLETIRKNAFSSSSIKSIIIPSSIKAIEEDTFSNCGQLDEIIFSSDSKLRTIEKFAFSASKIKSLTIPSELTELKKGWCSHTPYLTNITISPKNPRYCCYENTMIIGKNNLNQDNYDCLVFCVRDIKHIKVPNFIKHICSYSFSSCRQLEEVIIPSDSKLETIENDAFSPSKIKSIVIPSSVLLIGDNAFSFCPQLEKVIISSDSKLQTIEDLLVFASKIKSIIIPSFVTSIGDSAFMYCSCLKIIEINNREMISIYLKSFK